MRPGFMSSVCPKQTLSELIGSAKKYGYEGIEFRVEWDHKHGIELSSSEDDMASAQGMLEDSGIQATCIATGVQLNSTDAAEHEKERESLKRYIELAQGVGASHLRVFGDPVPRMRPIGIRHWGLRRNRVRRSMITPASTTRKC